MTQGEPQFVRVAGTKLLWARNTDADLFLDTTTNVNYVLIGGRWFRSLSRTGPWTFVAPGELPAEFSRIPEVDPAGEVLASVPGTPQAQEAVIANQIPQTAVVDRRGAKLVVTYNGEPQFSPIPGTSVSYALNTATPVVRVNDRYYACEDGVWFVGASPLGPWAVADQVPAAVYTIPPSCPIYYATYCRIYDSGPDWVCMGYTPGYFGCYVSGGCVVWGTGWWWHPWIGNDWYGCPWTYGFSVGVRWGFGWGWSVGIGLGSRPFGAPWWGPLGRPHPAFYPLIRGDAAFHLNMRNANIYGAWPRDVVRSREVRAAGPALRREARPNNVYSGSDGRVYRQSSSGWETREGGAWRSSSTQLDSDSRAREQGGARSVQRREAPSSPNVYQNMQSQHSSERPESRSAPQPIPPGLRGGGGTRGGGGGGHHGGR